MRLTLYKVKGQSMVPALTCGDFVLSFSCTESKYRKGDIVIACHPRFGQIIKRVKNVDSNDRIQLTGENQLSTSCDSIGPLPRSAILGRVIWRIPTFNTVSS